MSKLSILLVLFISISCKEAKDVNSSVDEKLVVSTEVLSEQTDTIFIQEEEVITQNYSENFNWEKVSKIKEQLIVNLKKDSLNNDKFICQFLEEYSEVQNEFNEELFELSNYDTLNSIAYSPSGNIYKEAIEFEKEVENNGFKIASSEGLIYFSKHSEFIKKDVFDKVDSLSIDFLNLYCLEIDRICCEDAMILITEKDLIKRAYDWGEMYEQSKLLKYKEICKNEFEFYLLLILEGQENTPSFTVESKKFHLNLLNEMKGNISRDSMSNSAIYFKKFITLLDSSDNLKSKEIDDFIKQINIDNITETNSGLTNDHL